jgi:hypothetical protein
MTPQVYQWEKLLDAVGVDPTDVKLSHDPALATVEALRRIALLKYLAIELAANGDCDCDPTEGFGYCDYCIACRLKKVIGPVTPEDEDLFCEGMNNLP